EEPEAVFVCQKGATVSDVVQEPRRVPSPAGDGIKSNLFFPATCASEKTLLSPQACEQSECDAAGCIPSSTCVHVRESLLTLSTGSGPRAGVNAQLAQYIGRVGDDVHRL